MIRHTLKMLGVAVVAASPLVAQGRLPLKLPNKATLLTLDSGRIGTANMSPDGKWIVFTKAAQGGSFAVWMASVEKPVPFRITADGFRDRFPAVSPTGDVIFFVSNRPTRDPQRGTGYVMSVSINKQTGQPSGPIRQVTTDSLPFLAPSGISPDGKWLAYFPAGNPLELRVVPSTGGNTRTIVTKAIGGGTIVAFSADGKHVMYQDSVAKIVRQVPLAGGAATTISTGGMANVPAPNSDLHYVSIANTQTNPFTMVVKNAAGQSLASLLAPRTTFHWRPDGKGIIDVQNLSAQGVSRVDLLGGASTKVLPAERSWPFALTPSGVLVRGDEVNGRIRVTSVTVSSGERRTVTLPAEIENVETALPNGTQLLAFGAETHQPMLRNKFSVSWRTRSAYLVDRLTGTTRRIADTVFTGCCPRNWGQNEASTGFAELRNGVVNINVFDATGNTRVIRSFPAATFARLRDLAVYRDRIAFIDSSGPTRSSVFIADGAGRARSVYTFANSEDPALAWSPDGRRLAVAYGDAEEGGRAVARVLDIASDGSVAATGPVLEQGGTTSYVESLLWLPDQSALLINRDEGGKGNFLVLRPVDASRPPVRVGDPSGVGQFFVEPDGKSVLITITEPGGSTIYTVPFTPIRR